MFFGIETEYAISCDGGRLVNMPQATELLMSAVISAHPHLQANAGGCFLGNGSRFYIDCGAHPELATPEVSTPLDAVRYVAAGDRLLAAALRDVDAQGGPPLRLARSNVDPTTRSTWACHENYSHACDPACLPPNLIPHLVSRIVLTGAGGFDPFRPLRFVLSPRVCFLQSQISSNSTQDRGIFHLKQESLATDSSHRLHVLCGESLASERSSLLRIGTTALVLALTECGGHPGRPLTLRAPLEAMRTFNSDPSLRARADLVDGRRLTAIEMQRELLQAVERRLGKEGFLPSWTEDICRLWRTTLDALERDSSSLDTELDWAIKRRLFAAQGEAQGLGSDTWPVWDARLADDVPVLHALGLSRDLAVPPGKPPVAPPPHAAHIVALRCQLLELDARFNEFSGTRKGLFRTLQEAGVLTPPRLGEATILQAVNEPPAFGRARLRGQLVHEYSKRRGIVADWSCILDGKGRILELSSPACDTMPDWQPMHMADEDQKGSPIRILLSGAEAAFNRGDYVSGHEALATIGSEIPGSDFHDSENFLFLLARVSCRVGRFAEGLAAVGRLGHCRGGAFNTICMHMVAHRYEGLVAGERIWQWIRRGRGLLSSPGEAPSSEDLFLFRHLWAHALILAGRVIDAREILQSILQPHSSVHPRVWCRALVDLAECHRRLGQPAQAYPLLQEAEGTQRREGAPGDVADYTLRVRVKLEVDDATAREAIALAETIHRTARSPMGQARMLLVEARRFPEDARRKQSLQKLRMLTESTPALQSCPLRERIEREWDTVWCARRQPVDKSAEDFYWGL